MYSIHVLKKNIFARTLKSADYCFLRAAQNVKIMKIIKPLKVSTKKLSNLGRYLQDQPARTPDERLFYICLNNIPLMLRDYFTSIICRYYLTPL